MQRRQPSRNTVRGLTLVEAVITIMIITALISVATPKFLAAREMVRQQQCLAHLTQIQSAKQQWMLDNDAEEYKNVHLSASNTAGLVPSYLPELPKCPMGGFYSTGTEKTLPTCTNEPAGKTATDSPKFPHRLPVGK